MTERKLSRREKEQLRHRDLIYRAAMDLFAEKGYFNVTMSEIAERAEFSIGTLYKFFESKDSIYDCIILDNANMIIGKLIGTIDGIDDPRSAIKAYIRGSAEGFSEAVTVMRLFLSQYEGLAGPRRKVVQEKIGSKVLELESGLQEVIRRGIREGVFREMDPVFLATGLMGLIKGYFTRTMGEREEAVTEADVENLYDLFMNGASLASH